MTTAGAALPHVDEHALAIDADREAVWKALLRVVEGTFASPRTGRFAHLLGCADLTASGPRPLAPGSAFPGIDGAAYRALVIGTRVHVVVTRRLLGAVAQRV